MAMADYSDAGFWGKLKGYATQAGQEVVEKALWLYYAAKSSDTPLWVKTVIYAALAYFISPFDAIPDFTPVIGYSDDLGVMAAALAVVGPYLGESVKEQSRQTLNQWFS
jgi:uncharacterized membrane protein YkvA (DUF1232 family)